MPDVDPQQHTPMDNTTQRNQDIGLPFSGRRGVRYLTRDEPSAPNYRRGGAPVGPTVSETSHADEAPGGSEVSIVGMPAAYAEQGTEDGPSRADTTSDAGREGDPLLAREEDAMSPAQTEGPSFLGGPSGSGNPPHVRTGLPPKPPPRKRKPLIQVATLNIRGCAARRRFEKSKLQESIRWMRANGVGVLSLQETYDCTENFAEAKRFNAKVWAFPNPGTTHSAGTGFLVHKEGVPSNLNKEDFTHEVLIEGRLSLLSWRWGGEDVTVANLYAPNDNRVAVAFFQQVVDKLKRRQIDMVMGDWNHVEEREDRLPQSEPTRAIKDALRNLRVKLDVRDSWREENPRANEFTRENTHPDADGTVSRSRLDRILMTPEMCERTIDHVVDVSLTISDHYPVRAKVIDNKAPDVGEGRWRMNLEDLEDEWAMEECRKILLECQSNVGRNPMQVWLQVKKDVRNVLKDRQTMRRKERGKHLAELKKRRKALTLRRDFATNSGLRHEEGLIRERIAMIETSKLDRATESSAAWFAEKGESVNKYWFSIGKAIKESSLINALTDDDEVLTRSTDRMKEIARDHHQRQQSCPDMSPEREDAIRKMVTMTEGKRFSEPAKEDLGARMTPQDAREAIKASQNGKSPGKDGIPYEFYKHWVTRLDEAKPDDPKVPDLAYILSVVWNSVGDGATPPAEYTEGLMFLLYKKKRKDKIVNYRPITLLGCDYKLQTKVMATRLGRNVQGVLHPDQAGFVPGRDILDHVKLAKHVKELCDLTKRNGCLVALDQEKAYDRIDHAYLWRILEGFNAPKRFVDTVKRLYEKATTSVLVNQDESTPFEVNRGVRQGDPLSCLLFDLAIEPMAEALRRSSIQGISIPGVIERLVVRLFADDTQVYLSKFDKWTKVKAVTDEWCLASTAKFNVEKTEFLPMGDEDYRREVCRWKNLNPQRIQTRETLPRDARFVRDRQPLRILGGIVGNRVDEEAIWDPVVSKVESLADKWSKRKMTLKGRRLITSFLMQSKAQYLMSTNDPPASAVKRIAKASHKVMWAGKKRGLTTMTEVERPVAQGGFGVPNFELRVRAARLMSAKKWTAPPDSRPLWAGVADEMIRLSSKKPDDPRLSSVLWQTWKETTGKTSKLPRDLQAMLKELRRYGVRAEALRFTQDVRDEPPVWMSKTVDLTPKDENSAAMRRLRNFHRVFTMGDLNKVRLTDRSCKSHTHCIEAINRIHGKTAPRHNARFATPLLEGNDGPDGLDFTQRRKDKAERDRKAGNPVTLDPSFSHGTTLSEAIRVFGTPPDVSTLPAFRTGRAPDRTTTTVVWTDGSATDIDTPSERVGFGVFSEIPELNVSARLVSPPLTNNRAELAAVVWSLNEAPTNVPIEVMTDSQYVVTGMTSTFKNWEDLGWRDVPNADLWRRAIYMVRSRTAETTISKVKAHANIFGNEQADSLAKRGSESSNQAFPDVEVPAAWSLEGARLQALDFSSAYEWVRSSEAKERNTRADYNLDRVMSMLREDHNMTLTESKVWLSLRKPYIRREISDFLWTMIHGRSPCGTMFSKWGPEWDDLQYCSNCGAVESMEHILTDCDSAIWRIRLWDRMAKTMRQSGIIPHAMCRPPSFAEIMGVGAIKLRNAAATRLWATLVSETAFTVWKLRNRNRFDGTRISTRMAKDLWLSAIEKRARTDLAASKLRGLPTAPQAKSRKEAVAAWDSLLTVQGGATVWNSADYG